MRIAVKINGASVLLQKGSLRLHSELGQRISTAEFTIVGEETWSPPVLAIAPIIAIGGYTRPYSFDECKIDRAMTPFINCAIAPVIALGGNSTYLDHFFGGYIISEEKTKLGVGDSRVLYRCEAQDYNILPAKVLVTESYIAKTEQEIIDDLFLTYLPEIDTSVYVESSGVTATIDWIRKPLNEVMEELASIFEREWYIDYEKYLHYFTPTVVGAPFILSDVPALTTRIGYKDIRHVEDDAGVIKKVTVVGDPSIGIVVTRQSADYDRNKIGYWFEVKYVDEAIDTVAWATLVADGILAESEFAKKVGRLTCYQEGLVKGQKVRIENDFRNIDDDYVIQSITLTMISASQEKVAIEYGDYNPRVTDLLLQIGKQGRKE